MMVQRDVELALAREWPRLRERQMLGDLLPRCDTHQWVHPQGLAGYVTLDYCLRSHVTVPGSRRDGPGEVSLVEQYWSVRTLDGTQDPGWEPSLNVHVIHIRPRRFTSADVEALLHDALMMRSALWRAGREGFADPARATLYIRAVLLGTEAGDDVRVLAELETLRDVPFRVATYRFSMGEGFSLTPLVPEDTFPPVGPAPDVVQAFGEGLIGDDSLPLHDWTWSGINAGPVYDHRTGLTVHQGKVIERSRRSESQ